MKFPNRSDIKSGFSLIESLVTLSIMSIAGLALMNLNVTGMKANKSNELRTELEDIRRMITNSIGCDQTLGTTRPSTCSGPNVLLIDKLGRPINSGGKVGSWTIEATCESIGTPVVNGLSIYATKKTTTGAFALDPLRNIPWDRSHPRSSLFAPNARLCSGSFATPVAAGECLYGVKVNPENQEVTCWKEDDPRNVVRKSELAIESLMSQVESLNRNVTDLYSLNKNQQDQINDLYRLNQEQQDQINGLGANSPWPANGYCIIQAPGNSCPAGFSPRNPGSSINGEAGLDGAFIFGGDSSGDRGVSVRGAKPGQGRGGGYNVMGWAFCCK